MESILFLFAALVSAIGGGGPVHARASIGGGGPVHAHASIGGGGPLHVSLGRRDRVQASVFAERLPNRGQVRDPRVG